MTDNRAFVLIYDSSRIRTLRIGAWVPCAGVAGTTWRARRGAHGGVSGAGCGQCYVPYREGGRRHTADPPGYGRHPRTGPLFRVRCPAGNFPE